MQQLKKYEKLTRFLVGPIREFRFYESLGKGTNFTYIGDIHACNAMHIIHEKLHLGEGNKKPLDVEIHLDDTRDPEYLDTLIKSMETKDWDDFKQACEYFAQEDLTIYNNHLDKFNKSMEELK